MQTEPLQLGVSDFVALFNQTMELAYPGVVIVGELANLRISKNRWLYFDLKDDNSTVKFFGTVYMLPGPLEDGMIIKVRGNPRLHNLYGFSVQVQSITPAGEGSIKRAAQLLQAKLTAEGLFDPARKRGLPYPPERIGLIASRQSAAYADFTKIVSERWPLVDITLIDVQVQGEVAPAQITAAISQFNQLATPPEVLVVIRGGGSAEDLAAFSTEQVTRAVAASRIPTVVAIGHEIDVSLAELAADMRASTPSNAAELLVPDKRVIAANLQETKRQLTGALDDSLANGRETLTMLRAQLSERVSVVTDRAAEQLKTRQQLLLALSPQGVLARGYAIVRNKRHQVVRGASQLQPGDTIEITFAADTASAIINEQGAI